MAAVTNIVIKDGAAVDHTFNPLRIEPELVRYVDKVGGIVVGFPEISISNRLPSKTAKSYKVVVRVKVPVLEQTSPSTSTGIQPAPTVAYNLIGNVELTMPDRCTLEDRKTLLAFVKNYLANASVTTAVESFELPY